MGISRADWGILVHVCWPVGGQAHIILLSKLLQASHRRLGIVVQWLPSVGVVGISASFGPEGPLGVLAVLGEQCFGSGGAPGA